MSPLAELPLLSFLGCCRGDWGPKELKAVQRKLAAIGIEDADALLRRVHDGSLNERLGTIGERRFTADTLEAIRSAGAQLAGPSDTSVSSRDSPETVDVEDLPRRTPGLFPNQPSIGRWAGGQLAGEPDDEAATLRKEICFGLSRVEAVAAEAKRRNGEVTRCLAEVQADIARITERMCAARQRRDRRSSAYAAHGLPRGGATGSRNASRVGGQGPAETAPSAPKVRARSSASQPAPPPFPSAVPAGPPPPGQPSALPRRPGSEPRQRRESSELRGGNFAGVGAQPSRQPREACGTRGMQSGFTFGGQQRSLRAPPREGSAAPNTSNRVVDPVAQAREGVRNQLLVMCGRPEADKRTCVKRLLVKWHPDRNPESIEVATAVFQYIQQEKELLLGL